MRKSRWNRAHPRFALIVPVWIQWCEEQCQREVEGLCVNISQCGLLVVCSTLLQLGQEVTVEVQLPPPHDLASHGLRLCSKGKVVRLENVRGQSGMAIETCFAVAD